MLRQLLVGPFVMLVYFQVLCYSFGVFTSCLFPSFAYDTHIFSLAHVVSLAFGILLPS
jgi:hypothetical protein